MAKNKTGETQEDVFNFIEDFSNKEQKRKDALDLVEFMKKITGFEPRMWGPSIIGFGHYHYKYASGHEGDAPLIGFSPRKTAISLYVFTGLEEHNHLLEGLGKFKKGKACIYVNKLSDIDEAVLEKLIRATIDYLHEMYS